MILRMDRRLIRIGSRDSKLAMAQTNIIIKRLQKAHPELELELVPMKTAGDKILDKTLDQVGGKGLFVKELDRALLEGEVDLCIHSLKDVPMELPKELPLVAYSRRGNPRDVLVLPQGKGALAPDGIIGTASPRRAAQLSALFPKNPVQPVRGNVLTRLEKLDSGEYSALVLAFAGLSRLHLTGRVSRVFSTDEMIPAAGQGILAVQGRKGEKYGFLAAVDDSFSRCAASAERAFVAALDGGCTSPTAAYAEIWGGQLKLIGLYMPQGAEHPTVGTLVGDAEYPERVGLELATRLSMQAR